MPLFTKNFNISQLGATAVETNMGTLGAGSLRTIVGGCTAVTHSNVASANADTVLLTSSSTRQGSTIFNDSTAVLYVKLGTGASATSFTAKLLAGQYYEVPYGYTAQINGFWDAANGFARIGSFT